MPAEVSSAQKQGAVPPQPGQPSLERNGIVPFLMQLRRKTV